MIDTVLSWLYLAEVLIILILLIGFAIYTTTELINKTEFITIGNVAFSSLLICFTIWMIILSFDQFSNIALFIFNKTYLKIIGALIKAVITSGLGFLSFLFAIVLI